MRCLNCGAELTAPGPCPACGHTNGKPPKNKEALEKELQWFADQYDERNKFLADLRVKYQKILDERLANTQIAKQKKELQTRLNAIPRDKIEKMTRRFLIIILAIYVGLISQFIFSDLGFFSMILYGVIITVIWFCIQLFAPLIDGRNSISWSKEKREIEEKTKQLENEEKNGNEQDERHQVLNKLNQEYFAARDKGLYDIDHKINEYNFLQEDVRNAEACKKLLGYLTSGRARSYRMAYGIYHEDQMLEQQRQMLQNQ